MEKLKEYLKEELTTEQLTEMARSVNSYNGGLDWLDYWENNEEFFETFFEGKIDDAVRAVCYGDYNYMDAYVKFNTYGNLESANEWEYEKEIEDYKEEIIEAWLEVYEEDANYLQYDDAFSIVNKYKEENNEGGEE